jgi:hypothetical protein
VAAVQKLCHLSVGNHEMACGLLAAAAEAVVSSVI